MLWSFAGLTPAPRCSLLALLLINSVRMVSLHHTGTITSPAAWAFASSQARPMGQQDPKHSARYRLLPMLASVGELELRDGLRYARRADVLTTYTADGVALNAVTRTVQGIPCLSATIFTVGKERFYLVDPLRDELAGAEWWEVFYFKDHIRVHPLGQVVCRPEAFVLTGRLLRHRYGRGSVIAELSRDEEEAARFFGVRLE